MSLKIQLSDAVKAAMRAKDAPRLATLRFLQAAIKQKEVDSQTTISDEAIVAIVEKQIKQRRESIAAFEKAGRLDTAAQEQAEMAILSEFLPEQLPIEEIAKLVQNTVANLATQGITGPAAMGKAMGVLKPQLAGKADMAQVSALLKTALT